MASSAQLSASSQAEPTPLGDVLEVSPAGRILAEITLPGDKSISHRAVLFAALARGESKITNFLPGEDTMASLHAMQAMGVRVRQPDATTLLVEGVGGKLQPTAEPIDCGNSGTLMRLLAGVLAGQDFTARLVGDSSLQSRPMGRIAEPLARMGARIECEGEGQRPPLRIQGSSLKGITYEMPVASAQLKSAILLAGLQAKGTTTVVQPAACRDHTERLLAHFHSPCRVDGNAISVQGGQKLHGEDLVVPGDFSSAAFWIVATAARPGSELKVSNVGLNPTRTALLSVLMRMGGHVRELLGEGRSEPVGTLIVRGRKLHGTRIAGAEIPNLIDELPIVAVAAALAHGETVIADAQELRVKETDRIAAMVACLRAFNVDARETDDGMVIMGGRPIKAAKVKSYGDHRIAMACAVLGLFARGTTRIVNPQCIHTSYPGFVDDLHDLVPSGSRTVRKLSKAVKSLIRRGPGNGA
ncbi:MAG: 3-phosphoshikimate 1-carboxyvinyltransferase [Verrucomicrobiota bacterium]